MIQKTFLQKFYIYYNYYKMHRLILGSCRRSLLHQRTSNKTQQGWKFKRNFEVSNFIPCINATDEQKKNFSSSSVSLGLFWGKTEPGNHEFLEKTYNMETLVSPLDGSGITMEEHSLGGEGSSVNSGCDDASVIDNSATETLTSTFADMGLGGSILPHRLLQDIFEYLHDTVGLEWCPAIAIVTVVLRILSIPGYVGNRAFTVRHSNHYPELCKIQQRITQGRLESNQFVLAKARIDYMETIKKYRINPSAMLMYTLPNGIMFMSMFAALRGMCGVPVESLVGGGILWFQNLSVADPYMVLPVISCLSMAALIRFGAADAELGPAAQMKSFRTFLTLTPIIALPFMIYQPAAMFAFWIVSNMFTFFLAVAFRRERIRRFFGIPQMIKHPPEVLEAMRKSASPSDILKQYRKQRAQMEKLVNEKNSIRETLEKMRELEKKKK